jgi:hypothetical protein
LNIAPEKQYRENLMIKSFCIVVLCIVSAGNVYADAPQAAERVVPSKRLNSRSFTSDILPDYPMITRGLGLQAQAGGAVYAPHDGRVEIGSFRGVDEVRIVSDNGSRAIYRWVGVVTAKDGRRVKKNDIVGYVIPWLKKWDTLSILIGEPTMVYLHYSQSGADMYCTFVVP